MSILGRACLLALAILLLSAAPALAAMWLRIEVAGPVVAGVAANVTVTTLVMYDQRCVTDPGASRVPNGVWYSSGAAPTEPEFRLVAYPAGHPDQEARIPLTHRAPDSPYWDGSVRFPAPGMWTVRMAMPYWGTRESDAERCAGARIDVSVSDAHSGPAPDPMPFLIGAVALALGAGLAARRLGQL